ncbi:DUF6051 family protein [Dysgonomonas massiliensis]|uniref:DUF6051 family protein n=1 Tax=Dysgonomonas massiliensis TaxID=2040292 RepID=UPI000C781D2C|nr:DUF6051 family protein [Dysgonomonas massiliensis]
MKYIDLHKYLKSKINFNEDVIEIDDNIELRNFDFRSEYKLLPGSALNNDDSYEYPLAESGEIEADIIQELIHKTDAEIEENINFRYHIVLPKGEEKTNKIILMFHGFNEKYWDKYYPWAYYLAKHTGKAVVMFPIAFHMNRAPAMWSDVRKMYSVSQKRKERYPEVLCSSLSNVAISSRLNVKPQRYIWSGFQTYYDVMNLVKKIKSGNHPLIEASASIDFMSYSIGTFLGEILMITNENNYFSESKYATFCGGAVFNRLSPVSKFILDSEANVALYSFLVEHLESHMKRDELLRKYLDETTVGRNFASMLNSNTRTEEREALFSKMSDQFYGILLRHDKIIPFYEVMNTMQGVCRDIPIDIDVLDFPYPYIHEDPFPSLTKIADEVDQQFRKTFNMIVEFLK